MNCEETAEFLSALYDCQKIPEQAARHIEACKRCQELLREHAVMGVELRRMSSLAPAQMTEGRWKTVPPSSSWGWRPARWRFVRIPTLAFVSLLAVVLGLGSGLAVMRARSGMLPNDAPVSRVLTVTLTPTEGEAFRCLLDVTAKTSGCSFAGAIKTGEFSGSLRVISDNGERVQLGIRTGFTPRPPVAPGRTYTVSVSLDSILNLPERAYWLTPGQPLEIPIDGLGTGRITARALSYIPSLVTSGGEQLLPAPNQLRVFSPALLKEGKLEFELQGYASADDKSEGVSVYSPGKGRYLLSLTPLEGSVQGFVNENQVKFIFNGVSYMFLTAAPITGQRSIWILREPSYKPSSGVRGARDDRPLVEPVDVSSLLRKDD